MKDECLICKAPLVYMDSAEEMECYICREKFLSKTKCKDGHFVCDKCHMQGLDEIFGVCMSAQSKNPYEIFKNIISLPFCHTHGPEHHIIVGASLLTAFKNTGGDIDLQYALKEMRTRGNEVPGGTCGFWGACGAGISAGIFISIITKATPLSVKPWQQANTMTAKSLAEIGKIGGPRCCKRNAYLAIKSAIDFVKEEFGIEMLLDEKIICTTNSLNNQCIGVRCPFFDN